MRVCEREAKDEYSSRTSAAELILWAVVRTLCAMCEIVPAASPSSACWEIDFARAVATSDRVLAKASFTWYDTASAPALVMFGEMALTFSFT